MPEEKQIKCGVLLGGIEADVDAALLQMQQIPGVKFIYVMKAHCALEIRPYYARK
jgi:hypothetical protein